MRLISFTNTTGGVDAFFRCNPAEAEALGADWHRVAIKELRKQAPVNTATLCHDPYPVDKLQNRRLASEEVEQCKQQGNLEYELHGNFTFLGV